MNRRDLQGLADALLKARPNEPQSRAVHRASVDAVAGYLQARYPQFDRDRFLRNAGVIV